MRQIARGVRLLRIHAITQSLFPPTTLKGAIRKLGFVQADPIRSPARAQDLILRHRVKEYRAGDLERRYASLDVEEDVLYAYGFVSRAVWRHLHPRNMPDMPKIEKKVLAVVRRFGVMHPRELEAHLGRERVVNAWGGYSKATTRALEFLHYRGLLRIARRESGVRVYEATPAAERSIPREQRLRELITVVANILAPAPEKSLQATIAPFRHLGNTRATLREMIHAGQFRKETVDGIDYIWPAARVPEDAPRSVKFLAPFDPLVWDRRRFEHIWGWPYRFEAYTPPEKRLRGYYAMPLLWGDSIIGWANAQVAGQALKVDVGFVGKRPGDAAFQLELDAEIDRLKTFLATD